MIAGASGLVGSACLHTLLQSPRWTRVLALSRRPLPVTHSKLETLVSDFATVPPLPPLEDACFLCALGTTIRKAGSQEAFREIDLRLPVALAKAAFEAGARHCAVVSSVDASAGSSNFYLRVKGEMEDAIRALGYPSLDIFRPSMLVGERAESRPAERVGIAAAQLLAPLLVGAWQRYRPIAAGRVGEAMVRAAEQSRSGERIWEWAGIRGGAL